MPALDADVLAAFGEDDARATIDALRNTATFIVPNGAASFRYHDPFREFLADTLCMCGRNAYRDVALRSASALERAGRVGHALGLFAQAGAIDDLLRVLERHGFALLDRGDPDRIAQALAAIPPEVNAGRSLLLALRAGLEANAGHFANAET